MPSQFEKYRFTKKTVLSDETFNRIWQDIDLRLVALEDIKKDWQGAVDIVTRYGLVRIEEVLRPSWEYIEQKQAQVDTIVEEIQTLRNNADAVINTNRDDAIAAVTSAKNDALSSISEVKNDALSSISEAKNDALSSISEAKNDTLSSISEAKNDALSALEVAKQQVLSQLDLNRLYAMIFFFGGD